MAETTTIREPTLWASSLTGSPLTSAMSTGHAGYATTSLSHAPVSHLRQQEVVRTSGGGGGLLVREPLAQSTVSTSASSFTPHVDTWQAERRYVSGMTAPVSARSTERASFPTSYAPLTAAAAAAADARFERERHASPSFNPGVTSASYRTLSGFSSELSSPRRREDSAPRSVLGGLSPFAAQKSQLCVLAGARGRRWGSLQSSWLVKNAFEAWRALSCRIEARPAEPAAERSMHPLEQRVLELENLLVERDRVITKLGQQLQAVDVKVDVDVNAIARAVLDGLSHLDVKEHIQGYHEQVMGALSGIQPRENDYSEVLHAIRGINVDHGPVLEAIRGINVDVDHGPVLDAIRGINTDVDHGPVLEAIRGINVDVDHGPVLEEVRRLHGTVHTAQVGSEVRDALGDLHRAVQGQEVDHSPVLEELSRLHERSQNLHGQLHQRIDVIEGMHKEHNRTLEEMLQVRHDLTALREELARDIAVVRAEAREASNVWARDTEILNARLVDIHKAIGQEPNHSPILAAITSSRNALLAAVESSKVDLDPVMGHLHSIRPVQVDHSPILDSISRINVEQDLSPVILAIREATHSILAAVHAIDVDHSPVLESIGRINFEVDHSPIMNAVHDAKSSILSAISAWEIDHTPVLDSIREINFEVDLSPVMDGLRKLNAQLAPPDMTPVMTAIRGAENRIVSAVGGTRVDLVPIVDEVHTKHQEAMQAIRRIRVDPVDLSPAISAINTASADLERAINKINFEVDHSEVLRAIRGIRHPEVDLSPVLSAISRCERDLKSSIAGLQDPPDVMPILAAIQSSEASLERSIRGIHIPPTDFAPVIAAVRKVDSDVERSINRLRSEVLETLGDLEPEQPDFSPVMRGIHNLANLMNAELLPIMNELKKVEPDLSHVVHEIHKVERDLLQTLQPEIAAILAGLNAAEVDMGPVLRSLERNRFDEALIAQTVGEVLRVERRDHAELIEAIEQLKLLLVSRPGAPRPPPPSGPVPMATATFPARLQAGVPLMQQLQHFFHAWQRYTLASGNGPPPVQASTWRSAPSLPVKQMPMLGPPPTLGAPPVCVGPGSQRLPLQPLANKIDGFLEELDYSRAMTPPHTPPVTPTGGTIREVGLDASPGSPLRSRSRLGQCASRSHVMERVSP